MIVTCKKEIPFRWILFSILPWASFGYTWGVAGVAFLFSLKKFVENPAGLTFILSLPTIISIIVGPLANFMSDRIWTRFGRRKPFIIVSWIGIATTLFLMPLMPNLWALVAMFMLYNFFTDLNAPLEPLKQEIIPPHERGRATGAMQWCANFAGIIFYFVALGRFDDVQFMAGFPIDGESVIYWSAGILLSVMLLIIVLGIREVDQKSALVGQRFSPRNLVGGLLDRELWPVYLLVVGSAAFNAGLGPLGNLLYTDQWNYSKQDMGINIAVGGVLNMFIIGLLTTFADKLNRMRAYRTLICLAVALNATFFCYVTFILPDQRPSLLEIIVFGETGSIIGVLMMMVYIPLVYDYVRRNKMGTYGAGSLLVQRLTTLVTLNGVGLFIWGYAALFQPPVGEMVRVVLKGDDNRRGEVVSQLHSTTWSSPATGLPVNTSLIDATAWQANGTVSDSGPCWEVRMRDGSSEALEGEKEEILKEKSVLEAGLQEKALPVTQGRLNVLSFRLQTIGNTLTQRAADLQRQVALALGPRLMTDGDQIREANIGQALLLEWKLTTRPDGQAIEALLRKMKRDLPDLIDLRPVKRDKAYGLQASYLMGNDAADETSASRIQQVLAKTILRYAPTLLASGESPLNVVHLPALTLDLRLVEEPLETYVSPIHRVVNLVLGLFDAIPDPARRLDALARNLRTPEEINHVRVKPGSTNRSIEVTAVLPVSAPPAPPPDDVISARLTTLLGKTPLPQAYAFYRQIDEAAMVQHLTVARPVLAAGYAPIKYNYMSGYLWMLLLGLMAIGLTLLFSLLEARGYIQKRGVIEAEQS